MPPRRSRRLDPGGRLILLALFLLIFAAMIAESRRATRNERTQRARGGVEPSGDVYPLMRVLYPGLFLGILGEGALRAGEGAMRGAPAGAVVVAGVVVFIAAKLLKWWAIVSLGSSWTFRVIVVPGATLVASGPYRYLRHPNYVAVIGEFVGAALVTGAIVTGPIAVLVFGALMLKRVAIEERALRG